MASASCAASLLSRIPTNKPWTCITKHDGAQKVGWIHGVFKSSTASVFCSVKAKAAANNRNKPNSVICSDCDGNGAVMCSQCKGSGVNSVDFFNGQFKAGDSCWLCGGRKEMLCGNCNGAGFVGGFLSTFDE